MSTIKISALPAATAVTSDDLVPIVDAPGTSPVTQKATAQQVKDFVLASTNGDANISGAITSTGNVTVNTNKFTVAASSGNTAVAGTLGVTGATTFTGNVGAASDIGSNASALATSATSGFLWAPSTAGTPTGTPSGFSTGGAPLVVDTSASKLWSRIGGSWSSVSFGAAPTSGLTLVTTLTASNSASLSYTSFSASSYQTYMLVFEDIWPSAAGNDFWVEGSVNGSTYGALWTYSQTNFTSTTVGGNVGTTQTDAVLCPNVGTTNLAGVGGVAYLHFGVAANQRARLEGHFGWSSNTPARFNSLFSGYYDNATALTSLKFLFSVGNIASGTIRIYGLQKS